MPFEPPVNPGRGQPRRATIVLRELGRIASKQEREPFHLPDVGVDRTDLLGGLHQAPPRWASWLRVALGSALIAFGIYTWLTRHRHRKTPVWLRSFSKLTPVRAGVTGRDFAGAE